MLSLTLNFVNCLFLNLNYFINQFKRNKVDQYNKANSQPYFYENRNFKY